jgi:hypothetical protein
MSLTAGTRLGPSEIVNAIGTGGMGGLSTLFVVSTGK